ncbi:MAG: YkgJ family cysteine cluster protein [Bacteroidota bacterium]
MQISLEDFRRNSQRQKDENKVFYAQLKRRKPKNLDDSFHELHEEVFAETDCLQCANCCKTTSPLFTDRDIERVAKALRMKPADFITEYLKIDEDGDYVLRSAPCPFLDADNYCAVYKDRPTACREYPHTDRKRMAEILDITFNNTLICPAVLAITEKLKKVY